MRLFPLFLCMLPLAAQSQDPAAQLPFEAMPPGLREEARDIVRRADFVFNTRTQPKRVKLATMEKLFDHPRLGAAMWRYCQFAPSFYAFTHPDGSWSIDDTKGLKGTLWLIYQRPGHRIYLVEGAAEKGRLKTPFTVKAKMLTSYRYWDGPKGFESNLQTWTALDSAVLGIVAKPFTGYIRGRQNEFIEYINGNIALFGEFAQSQPEEFLGPLQRDGDPMALRDYERLFLRK
jgi:hypothetical protein